MLNFKTFISEGVDDHSIFKAVMFAGGPGSGKTRVVQDVGLRGLGFRVVNNDPAFENALAKAGLDKGSSEDIFSAQGQTLRKGAKKLTGKMQELYLKGRLGVVIDGTGKNLDKMKNQAQALKDLGYDVAMVFVDTDLDTTIERDKNRDRTLGASAVTSMWNKVQANKKDFKSMFGQMFIDIDNSIDPTRKGGFKDLSKPTQDAFKKLKRWANTEPKNPKAKKWIAQERAKKKRT